MLWYRICGCDIPSSAGAEGGGRTQASGQEHTNADLWLQQEERNLVASYPSLPPLSNHTDSGVSRCQKKIQKALLLNCRVRDYQLPWRCHTYEQNYVHHVSGRKIVTSIPLHLCLPRSSVRYQIGTSSFILPNWIQLLTSCNLVFYWDFVLQRDLDLADCS